MNQNHARLQYTNLNYFLPCYSKSAPNLQTKIYESSLTRVLADPDRLLEALHCCVMLLSFPVIIISGIFGNLLEPNSSWLLYGTGVVMGISCLYGERENEHLDPNGDVEKIKSFMKPYFLCWNVTMIRMVLQFGF